MEKRAKLILVVALALLVAGCTNNRGVVERPEFVARSSDLLEIARVSLSDTATILHVNIFHEPGGRMKMDPNSFLRDNKGRLYSVRWAEGLVLGEEFHLPDSGESSFVLAFPPVASDAGFVDFVEGDEIGAYKIWGIQLTGKPLKTRLPAGYSNHKAVDKNAVLSAGFRSGTARLEGQILNYHPGMENEVEVTIEYPFQYPPSEELAAIDEKGKFSIDLESFACHPVTVRWANVSAKGFVAAGKTTSFLLNPIESSRKQSVLSDKSRATGEEVYYGGYMASISKELAAAWNVFSVGFGQNYATFLDFLRSMEGKTPEGVKEIFINEHRTKLAILDTLQVSPACRQILHAITDLVDASSIINTTLWVDRAYVYNNQLQDDQKAIDDYFAKRKYDLPPDYYDVLKEFTMLNDSTLVYFEDTGSHMHEWQMNDTKSLLIRALGTDRGPLFDLLEVTEICAEIEEFIPVDETRIARLPSVYQEFIRKKNNEALAAIDANKHKTGYTIHDIENIPEAKVFPSIIALFKGKPILIDVWATWCGPCRVANEELKPLKEELSDKGIVYVFIAGENSPLGTWKNMIADLHGEHFRLTEKQWNYMGTTLGLNAVPSYFFIDREGNIVERETGYPGVSQMKEKLLRIANQ
jgi:thiol-disulfide isomerase/thioredoxin